ncbi:hypothetical protein COOONC_16255 [Cooperia oncophora]
MGSEAQAGKKSVFEGGDSTYRVWGALSVKEKQIMFCNPPLALNGSANRFWIYTNLAIIFIVLILHFTVWVILKRKERQVSIRRIVWKDQKRALHSVTLHLVLFFWSWCTTIIGIELCGDVLRNWLSNVDFVDTLQSCMVFFAPVYSHPTNSLAGSQPNISFFQGTTANTVLFPSGLFVQSKVRLRWESADSSDVTQSKNEV